MKQLLYLILLIIPITGFAKTETDTITNWQLYKDGKIVFKSNISDSQRHTVTIEGCENFKELKLYIQTDTRKSDVRRKLLFKLGDKLIYTFIRKLEQDSDPIIISQQQLLIIIGPSTNEYLTVEYTDDMESKGMKLFEIILKDK